MAKSNNPKGNFNVIDWAVKLKRLIIPKRFDSSGKYWEDRYKAGGNSGAGSYNHLAEFKAEVINSFVADNKVESVIEFGCGDGNQLKYFNFKSYTGYDVSKTVVDLCRTLFKGDETKEFRHTSEYDNPKADLTMSLDVIYHLIEDEVFNEYMEKLFSSSKKYVIIYSSNTDDNDDNGTVLHVKHRKFTDWVESNKPEFNLLTFIPNKFPFNKDGSRTSFADFYIFEKKA